MNKYLPYVRFLKDSFHIDCAFHVGVLTSEQRKIDSRVPPPGLLLLESQDLFRLLEKRELVTVQKEGISYFLNKVQPHKWDELISDLKRPAVTYNWWFKAISSLVIFILSAGLGGLVGGYFNQKGEDLASQKPVVESGALPPGNSHAPNSTPKDGKLSQPVKKPE